MSDQIVFTATEARQNFFELLRMAEEGKEPIVVKKANNIRFKMTMIKEKRKKKNIDKILKEMGEIGLKTMPWRKMKKIILTLHDIKI
ncbi:MAG: type II toxin-antitoxin system prevent-host-death family antitoxin [Patescibacteria group bacterium]